MITENRRLSNPHVLPTATRYNRLVRKLARISMILMSVALYGASFFLPVVSNPFGWGHLKGYEAFVVSFPPGIDHVILRRPVFLFFVAAWLANPAGWFGFGCSAFGKPRYVFLSGSIALALAVPLQAAALWESRNPTQDVFGPGYWVWLSSFVALVVAGLVGMAERFAENPYGHG